MSVRGRGRCAGSADRRHRRHPTWPDRRPSVPDDDGARGDGSAGHRDGQHRRCRCRRRRPPVAPRLGYRQAVRRGAVVLTPHGLGARRCDAPPPVGAARRWLRDRGSAVGRAGFGHGHGSPEEPPPARTPHRAEGGMATLEPAANRMRNCIHRPISRTSKAKAVLCFARGITSRSSSREPRAHPARPRRRADRDPPRSTTQGSQRPGSRRPSPARSRRERIGAPGERHDAHRPADRGAPRRELTWTFADRTVRTRPSQARRTRPGGMTRQVRHRSPGSRHAGSRGASGDR